ncbi:MAG: hypothetical protein HW416_415 [Chloroflexi bacterium]|nr:hypothetical protein [Chloroflexota bacterium]
MVASPWTRAESLASSWVDIRTPAAVGDPLGLIGGYSGLSVEVSDLDRAVAFYSDLLGFGPATTTSNGKCIALNASQSLRLVSRAEPRVVADSGVHQAYTLPSAQIDALVGRLESGGVSVDRYHEDRQAELRQNRYCHDPDGNRVQLVSGRDYGLDHVAFETHDVEWAEVFYTQVLGARVEERIGWKMADFAGAWAWGSGEDQCAPGTRRWDTLYTDEKDTVPRPCAQLFVTFAPGTTIGLYLPNVHRQEPPRRQFRGTPSVAFSVLPGKLDELEQRLRAIRLRCMEPSQQFGGPYERSDATLFVRDNGGNFLEFREG